MPALQDQIAKIIHSSNYYHVPGQETLAAKLVELSGLSNVFFCSTGLEANEAALKLARKFGHDKGIDKPEIVVYEKAFHGRSIATLSATGNEKVQKGFGPLVEGWRILDHDRDIDCVGYDAIEFENRLFRHAERGAVIGRHDHHHRSACVLGLAAALGTDARAKMRRRHDNRHPAGDMRQRRLHHLFALGIGQHELLGEIGENAQAVGAGVDHEIDATALSCEIELPAFVEDGRNDGKNAAIGPLCGRGH